MSVSALTPVTVNLFFETFAVYSDIKGIFSPVLTAAYNIAHSAAGGNLCRKLQKGSADLRSRLFNFEINLHQRRLGFVVVFTAVAVTASIIEQDGILTRFSRGIKIYHRKIQFTQTVG